MTSTTGKTIPVGEVAEWSDECKVDGAEVVWSGANWFGLPQVSAGAGNIGVRWARRDS